MPSNPSGQTTKRSTAPRKPRTTAKRPPRTTAARATTSSSRPAAGASRAQQLGRAVLIPVGAALEARDRFSGTVGELVAPVRSRDAFERQLTRFERRGGRARTQVERELRRTRRRLDANVELVSDRVENVVQNGVNAGIKLVNGVQDRFSRAA
jgi:hypothetical protein